ncbi:MAG: tetratricopeptide repeat protein [Desulfobulbaceae bacterium]|nr:tetratricopeptide repeat protein [Desulfobulbaceae bacterium]
MSFDHQVSPCHTGSRDAVKMACSRRPQHSRPIRYHAGPALALLWTLFLAGCWSLLPGIRPAVCLPLAPEKTITIVTRDGEQPAWKHSWDRARELVKKEQYEAAITSYLSVLEEKPHIEEVRWELCKVLITVGDYERASWYLEGLLELDPTRNDYLISAGTLALAKNDNERAFELFGQVLEQDPFSSQANEALTGMVQSLRNRDRVDLAIPLMEQLYQRGSANPELILDLARAAERIGDYDKACHYYAVLVKKYRVAPTILEEAAELFENRSRIDDAAALWQRLLEERPDDLFYHEKLADYRIDRDQKRLALPHLLALVEHGIRREELLPVIADIYLYEEGRIDRALAYFEQYRNEFPAGKDVSARIADIQLILANDLLTIVENNGAWMLWRDLATVTPDRIGIYRAMAGLLEKLGKRQELAEVLQIIVLHEPGDTDSLSMLARLYLDDKQFASCISLLQTHRSRDDFPVPLQLTLARCQRGAGDDVEQLNSLVAYLQHRSSDLNVRGDAIKLAGRLGFIDTVEKLKTDASAAVEKTPVLLQAYLDALIANHLYATAQRAIDNVLVRLGDDPQNRSLLLRRRAEILAVRGNSYQAEEVLRSLLAEQPDSPEALLSLAGFALDRHDYNGAAVWLAAAEQLAGTKVAGDIGATRKPTLFHLQAKLRWYTGNRQQALNQLFQYFTNTRPTKPLSGVEQDMLLFFMGVFLQERQAAAETARFKELLQNVKPERLAGVLSELLSGGPEIKDETIDALSRHLKALPLAERLDTCHILIGLQQPQAALAIGERVQRDLPETLRARVLVAQALSASGKHERAEREFLALYQQLPNEQSFSEEAEQLAVLLGRPKARLTGAGRIDEPEDILADPRSAVLQARSLWSEDRWDEALKLYGTVQQVLDKQVLGVLERIKSTETFRRTFPESARRMVLISKGDEEMLDEIMSPSFFVAARTEDIVDLAASSYASYRWWKIINKEREAKLAINAREFYQAERTYQELQDIDESAVQSSYADLATIYSRLGKRQKEAQLFEKLKESQQEVPVLKEAAEKIVRQRQPHLSLDSRYREEQGRDGHIDITQGYAGANVQFNPAVFHEAGAWFGRNEYGNSDASTLAKSVYISGRYALQFNEYLKGEINAGFEDFDTDGKSFVVFDIGLEGNLEEKVNIFVSLNQRPVADTIESLTAGLYKKQFRSGITIDYLPRVFLGFDFSMHDYSDINDGRVFNLFASYRFFREQSSFDLSYRYQKIENSIDNEYGDDQEDTLRPELTYWSPGKYWQHLATAEYRFDLWPTGKLQGGTSYVSALYGLGIEKGDSLVQKLTFTISLEMSPLFLVKGGFSSDWSDDYDHYGVSASLAYRW